MTVFTVSASKELEQHQMRCVEEQKKLAAVAEQLRADQELLVSYIPSPPLILALTRVFLFF